MRRVEEVQVAVSLSSSRWIRGIRWLAPLGWMGVIFWLASQPQLPSAPDALLDLVLKKVGHAVIYGVLATLWWQALLQTGMPSRQAALWAAIISGLYGVTDEFHQSFVPGRSPRGWDVLIDALGASVAMATRHRWLPLIQRLRPGRLQRRP